LAKRPDCGIAGLSGGLAETTAAYRFFSNEKAGAEKVLAPHLGATMLRMQEEKVVPVIQDTTECDYSGRGGIADLGWLNWEESVGFFSHVSLAVTPERLSLGVLDAYVWTRDSQQGRTNKARKEKALAEKQSQRWIAGYQVACHAARQLPETRIIGVSDGEGDIYEMFVAAADEKPGAAARRRALHDRLQQ
jgi:hypothetical protein